MASVGSKIAKRYARSLLALCEAAQFEETERALKQFAELWEENDELKAALRNPAFNMRERGDVVNALVRKICPGNQLLQNFCGVLLDRGRIEVIGPISQAFSAMILELKKLLAVKISAAFDPAEGEIQDFKNALQKEFGSLSSLEWELDKGLIGGLKVQIGDRLLDDSLRGKLDRLRAELLT